MQIVLIHAVAADMEMTIKNAHEMDVDDCVVCCFCVRFGWCFLSIYVLQRMIMLMLLSMVMMLMMIMMRMMMMMMVMMMMMGLLFADRTYACGGG